MPRPGPVTAAFELAYQRLLDAGELEGPEDRTAEWLGCAPDSLRRRAAKDGRKITVTTSRRVRGPRLMRVAVST